MWDGSAVPLDENLKIAEELLELTKAANIILEIEVGVVGGEEDGVVAEINEKLYTSPDDFIATLDALGLAENNTLHRRRDVRQRARRVQAGRRQAAPRGAQGRARTRWPPSSAWRPAPSRSRWCSTAVPARRRRRSPRRCPTA